MTEFNINNVAELIRFDEQQRYQRDGKVNPTVSALLLNGDLTDFIPIHSIVSISMTSLLNEMGSLTLQIPAQAPYVRWCLGGDIDKSLIVEVSVGSFRTLWFVTHIAEVWDNGVGLIELSCASPEIWLQKMYCRTNPRVADVMQINKEGRFICGPCAQVLKEEILLPEFKRHGVWTQRVREHANYTNWQGWAANTILGSLAQEILNALDSLYKLLDNTNRSIHQVAPTTVEDTRTRSTVLSLRMNNLLEVTQTICKTEMLTLTAQLKLPGRDNTSTPHVLWDTRSRMTIPNWTQLPIVGGILEFTSNAWETIKNATPSTDTTQALPGTFTSHQRHIIHKDQYTTINITTTKPTAWYTVVGGRSNPLVNYLSNLASNVVINTLTSLLPAVGATIAGPAGAGIGGVVGGILNSALTDSGWEQDRLLSFQYSVDYKKGSRVGALGLFEDFQSGTAFTFDSFFAIRQLQYKSRTVRTYEVELPAGESFTIGTELNLGDEIGLELPRGGGVLAWVTRIDLNWEQGESPTFTFSVSDRAPRSSQESLMQSLGAVASLANRLLLVSD